MLHGTCNLGHHAVVNVSAAIKASPIIAYSRGQHESGEALLGVAKYSPQVTVFWRHTHHTKYFQLANS